MLSSRRYDQTEGTVAKAIEEQTSRLPSDFFLWLAGGAIVGSLALQVMGRKETSNFIGTWVPTVLILGLYNKLVKQHGHDYAEE
ncbi:MAG: hypothetical protein KBD01_16345 [Acidobacteria bacterium]|nr:hypothetical protein [Acidobacteriota bacterium]